VSSPSVWRIRSARRPTSAFGKTTTPYLAWIVEGGVELQGDLRERARDVLVKRGYVVKG
jgi:hypothetical protein